MHVRKIKFFGYMQVDIITIRSVAMYAIGTFLSLQNPKKMYVGVLSNTYHLMLH
jgi:hypothetical protein